MQRKHFSAKQQKKVPNSANIESFCIKDDSQKYKPYSEIYKALHRLSDKEQSTGSFPLKLI
ncbi:hypothetical protein DW830_15280 [Prevotella sp. AM34-19LB]|nr:hypothetical protein DW830_15280 [Prevotella sp. AM34-19LB]